jgi:cytochrome c biogenesis protein CcmG, thiol:disulfide interchange protein DsbE
MGTKSFAVVIAVLAVIGLLGYGLLSKAEGSLTVGEPAPDKELPTLDGTGTGSIADYRGQWVLVNFWASWCDPCREEAPALQRFYERYRDQGVTVLGIDLDDATEDARDFVEEFGLTYPQLRDGDGDEWRDDYAMTGFPESFLIDPEGDVAQIRRGPVNEEYLTRHMEPLIRGTAGAED